MYRAKIPALTAEIERRIRRQIYSKKLPAVSALQKEFHVAKQTVTEAVRVLAEMGIVTSSSWRTGMQICRENLRPGSIAVISRDECLLRRSKLVREIAADGLTCCPLLLSKTPMRRSSLPDDLKGVLFINSSLTVEWAEFLQTEKIPLVSCNELFSSPRVDMVDYDMDQNLTYLMNELIRQGYKRIGLFYSGLLEGFNDIYWREFRQLKKRFNLLREPYDDIRVNWSDDYLDKLKYTFRQMKRLQSFPEVMISFYYIEDLLQQAIEETDIIFPDYFHILMIRPNSKPPHSHFPRVDTFHVSERNINSWISGYGRLRELIFSTAPRMPELRLIQRRVRIDAPVKKN